jgi:hypothetical protein
MTQKSDLLIVICVSLTPSSRVHRTNCICLDTGGLIPAILESLFPCSVLLCWRRRRVSSNDDMSGILVLEVISFGSMVRGLGL